MNAWNKESVGSGSRNLCIALLKLSNYKHTICGSILLQCTQGLKNIYLSWFVSESRINRMDGAYRVGILYRTFYAHYLKTEITWGSSSNMTTPSIVDVFTMLLKELSHQTNFHLYLPGKIGRKMWNPIILNSWTM